MRKGDIPVLLRWIKERQSKPEAYGTTLLSIRPNDNLLVGSAEICSYLRISHYICRKWMENFNLPIMRRPDGVWMTTISSLDQWVWLACFAENEARLEAKKNADKNPERSPDQLSGAGQQLAVGAASDHAASRPEIETVAGAIESAIRVPGDYEAIATQADDHKDSS